MKILFDHSNPFLLAHGGFQIQIEHTKAALEMVGLQVEFLRWWDDQQKGDLIHFFGVPSNAYLQQASSMKLPVIMTALFTETCNRSEAKLWLQSLLTQSILKLPFPEGIKQQLSWRAFGNCAHNIVGIEAERRVLEIVYRVPNEQISVVPLGLSEDFLRAASGTRCEKHLICTGTITRRKNSVELAEMAHAAQVPILFVGKPYHLEDDYWLRFERFVDNRWVKHHQHVCDEEKMIQLLQSARGFVMMSQYENWCLSAHEAAACCLPLLVQDQNWSRERFGDQAHYFRTIGVTSENIETLRRFYQDASNLPPPRIHLHSWAESAQKLKSVYERVLNSSR